MSDRFDTDFTQLIPELPVWNNGAGRDAQSWIECVGNYQLAVGYSFVFWPTFVRFEGYVLREGFSEFALRTFEQPGSHDRRAIEAVMNHLHLADIHCNVEATEEQLRHLGRVLRDIHRVKLAHDFPDLNFETHFNDEPGLDHLAYELTFFQTSR